MKLVDTRGERCPKPIIETKKALREVNSGETFSLLIDNRTSFINVSRFLKDNKVRFIVTEKTGVWEFLVTKDSAETILKPAEAYRETESSFAYRGDYVVAVSSDSMGHGDDILGRRLMKSFFTALSVADELPGLIAFYNTGAKLAADDSEVFNLLKELEEKGVEIFVCGTCVDHFKLTEKVDSSKIVDMYFILQKLTAASKVIKP